MALIDDKLDEYREKFGVNYPLAVGMKMREDDVIEHINECIESGEKANEPEYRDDCDY